jgi:hypothetical protein
MSALGLLVPGLAIEPAGRSDRTVTTTMRLSLSTARFLADVLCVDGRRDVCAIMGAFLVQPK